MRIAFRTDASDTIGTGHLIRCLTLADALAAAGHECRFALRDHPGCPAGLIGARGFTLSLLTAPEGEHDGDLAHAAWLGAPQAADAAETLAAIGPGWDWIVADHYGLDWRWEGAMRAAAARVLAIDDLADRRHDCDLLLDQNLQRSPDRYEGLVPAGAIVLLGPRFALLRREFAGLGDRLAARPPVRGSRILIYFGGIDPDGATLTALEGVVRANRGLAVDVVAGPRNPHLVAIRRECAGRGDVVLHEGDADMSALMAGAALAIGGAGATAWERCCLSLPTILITIAANQRPGAEALAALPAALWIGDAGDVSAQTVADAIETLVDQAPRHAALAAAGRSICDGHGTARVVAEISARSLDLRPAGSADCDPLLAWRNHPDTRRYFHDPGEVSLDEHRAWFAQTCADPDRRLWIGESKGAPVGVIRFDRADTSALVSIYLVPGHSGRGLGTALIVAGCRAARGEWPGLRAIDAEALPANEASTRAFAKAGFASYEGRWRLTLEEEFPA